MKNRTSVAILLTTFNSAPFLDELFTSILAQDNHDWTVFASDDGSADGTVEILRQYAETHPNHLVIVDFPEKHVGASQGFERLMNRIGSQWYMFCDHDDVWMPRKISLSLEAAVQAESKHPGMPLLVHTDLAVADRELKPIAASFAAYSKIDPARFGTLPYLYVANCVTGCTILMNDLAKRIIPSFPAGPAMYDWWIALNVARSGKLIYLPQPTVVYRQHDTNVVGARKGGMPYIWQALAHPLSTFRTDRGNLASIRKLDRLSLARYLGYKILFQLKRYSG